MGLTEHILAPFASVASVVLALLFASTIKPEMYEINFHFHSQTIEEHNAIFDREIQQRFSSIHCLGGEYSNWSYELDIPQCDHENWQMSVFAVVIVYHDPEISDEEHVRCAICAHEQPAQPFSSTSSMMRRSAS